MKTGLCNKLAFFNIRKNRRFFIPRILSETGLLACFYIIFTLACDGRLASVKGGEYLPTFMRMGVVIIGFLSFIMILYTNSFLMKQRKREFGLYSVLGMEKKHVCRILFCESYFCSIASVVLGLLVGTLFYKLSSLVICKLLQTEIVAGFYFLSLKTVLAAAFVFIVIDLFAFIVNCIGIVRMKPVELLNSKNAGEKEPKVKWVLLVLGLVSLGVGYYISLTTSNPLDAILLFFVDIVLVIVGTYFLFVAGSIFVLKALKKRERYYYRPSKITAVSGLLYRMKQNAVGLASVAILATGVLIMISSTFCLYSRAESVLKMNYPQDFYVPTVLYDNDKNETDLPNDFVLGTVTDCANKHGLKIKDTFFLEYFDVAFSHKNNELITDREYVSEETDFSSLCNITFITEKSYVSLGGEPLGLKTNEVAVCPFDESAPFGDDEFVLCNKKYKVSKNLTFFPINTHLISVNRFGFVVADDNVFADIFNGQKDAYKDNASLLQSRFGFVFENREKALSVGKDFSQDVEKSVENFVLSNGFDSSFDLDFDSVWEARENLYGMYGTLLFLGALLGLVCLFATVLIIYYKQISEGYEDRNRYQIMQKIGLTKNEVKKSIRSQILLVFFLPLITAGVHIVFAYPILTKLMEILLLDDVWLFAKWCIIVYIVFAFVYALIYKLTAKTYYKIVY